MKQNDFMQGRNEGMRLALTIAERDGIDGLRNELKYRGITNLNLNVSHKEMLKATEHMRQSAFDTMRIFVIGILMDRYGFGKKRIFEFIDNFNEGCTMLESPDQWQDMKDKVNDYIGCDLIVRWNDINSKIHAGE